jgi:argininosuccinate lyase
MEKLWGGRFREALDPEFARFNASFLFDRRLLRADIRANAAYCRALRRAGVLSEDEEAQIRAVVGSRGETARMGTEFNAKRGLSFPCVFDTTGAAAASFNARTTLTLIIDRDRVLRYRGPLAQDGKAYARLALEAVLDGKDVGEKEVEDKTS